jgi:hypothetical protein
MHYGGRATDSLAVDTLTAPVLPDPASKITFTQMNGSSRTTSIVRLPYSPKALWAWSPQGYFLTAITNRYAIDTRAGAQTQLGNNNVRSLRLDVPPLPISPAELRDQSLFFDRAMDAMRGQREGSLPGMPRVKPFIKEFSIANDRRLWVSVHVESERYSPAPLTGTAPFSGRSLGPPVEQIPWREPNVYDVFEPDGTYVGRVRLPYDFVPLAAQGDDVWGVFRDEFDVEYVHRYRVQWN